jgi:hypothetical protein
VPGQQIWTGERQRYPDALYERAQELLFGDGSGRSPSAASVARELQKDYSDGPSERTVADWIRRGVIRAVDPNDIWSLAKAMPGQAVHVLPVIAYLNGIRRKHGRGRPYVTRHEARVITRLGEHFPMLTPLERFRLATMYGAGDWLTVALDAFLGELLDGLDSLRGRVASGDVTWWPESLWSLPMSPELVSPTYEAVQEGLRQRREAVESQP